MGRSFEERVAVGLAADRPCGRRMLGNGVEDSLNSSAQEKSIRKVLDLHHRALRTVMQSVSREIANEIDECHGVRQLLAGVPCLQ